MKIAHVAVAVVLAFGSAFAAVEPAAAAMPRSTVPLAAGENIEIVQVRHRHYRHHRPYYRHGWRHHRYHRHWRAERRWREHRHWRYHDRYYRPHRSGVYLHLRF
jgi:hypothetical protein